MRRYRPLIVLLLSVGIPALVGGTFGRRALALDDNLADQQKTFVAALRAIETNYVDEVPSDRLVYSAIRGMLGTLDPHSSFFDPKEYAQMRERQEGRYYGLGITIAAIDGDIVAQSVFEGSPAYKMGVRRGDIIARIGGDDAKGWSTEQAMVKLRGPKGTNVRIELKRRGYEQPIPLEVTRDEVHILTVPSYFGENTDREVKAALRDLTKQGMKRLLFDARQNPGGPLDQAIKVANSFLPKGKMIVYTRGRIENSRQDYRAADEGEFQHLPIVMLVNRNSASASEIVTGALQDHDRAYIVGETTFGKALVQSVYRIANDAGLALTTAHYYTPSGRLIQRPWDASFDEYLSYGSKEQEENKAHNPADLKRTQAGRAVYSGGGVEPDRHVPGQSEGFNPSPFGRLLVARQEFEDYAQKFTAEGDTRIAQQATGRRNIAKNFTVDDAMIADFREHLKTRRLKIDEDAFAKDLPFIKAMIRFRIDETLFGMAEAKRHLISQDPQAQAGLTLFGEAEKLLAMGKGMTRAH